MNCTLVRFYSMLDDGTQLRVGHTHVHPEDIGAGEETENSDE
jgi:hypothetical protein